MDKLIAHAPHDGPEFIEDNATVLLLLQDMLANTSHMSSMNHFQRTRDGRGTFQSIQLHSMGKSKQGNVMENADSMVQTRMWNGKNSRFPLKAHINKHR